MKKLENQGLILSPQQGNIFLIDWLTVTFHSDTVLSLKVKLGLSDPSIAWDSKRAFINGYPMCDSFSHISIHWGADEARFYDDSIDKNGVFKTAASKVRSNMGISLNMSGQGCRAFEEYSDVSWVDLFTRIFEANGKITRLDLAYDDHVGILDIRRIKVDIEDRNYVSKSKKSQWTWSDDQEKDIHGNTGEVGSRSSPVLIRIYDKAAERGFKDRHWIRVELQLREKRAQEAGRLLFRLNHVGRVATGILRNYLTFRVPSADTNKSRWPIAYYWEQVLMNMEKLAVWVAPGEPYNFSKTENQFFSQYGQVIQAYYEIHGNISSILDRSRKCHPQLKTKYLTAISEAKLAAAQLAADRRDLMSTWGLLASDDPLQADFSSILHPDPNVPW